MNKIKHLAFAMSGALLVTVGLISCDNDEVMTNEETSVNNLQARGGYTNVDYQGFYLGQAMLDGGGTVLMRYDAGPGYKTCFNFGGNCLPDLIIWVPGKKTKFLQLVNEPTNYRAIFAENEDLFLEDIHPILVNGIIDGFFKLEVEVNDETETNYFRFKRVNDDVLVGTYPIIID